VRTTRATPSMVVVINVVAIVLAAAFAIVFHAVLPAPVEGIDFDSAWVRLVGFPVVADWMLFNSFIGMLFSGAMPQMLLRSGLDTAVVFVASVVVLGYVRRDARGVVPMPTDSA
jgi:hypothetical protein